MACREEVDCVIFYLNSSLVISFLFSGMDQGRILIWTPLEREKDERILRQHSGVVDSLSFSPDGRFLASADTDGKLIIWSTEVSKENETI